MARAIGTTAVAISTASGAVCAHCGAMLHQGGVVGSYQIRPCADTQCRHHNDGGWNLLTRVGNLAVTVALPRRLSQSLIQHTTKIESAELLGIVASAGNFWGGK